MVWSKTWFNLKAYRLCCIKIYLNVVGTAAKYRKCDATKNIYTVFI
jgi:hypothetical protein